MSSPSDSDSSAPAASSFGAVLLRRRHELGLSQEELAEAAGVHRNTLSHLERGRYAPSLDVLLRIARGLGTTGATLVAEVETDLGK